MLIDFVNTIKREDTIWVMENRESSDKLFTKYESSVTKERIEKIKNDIKERKEELKKVVEESKKK